MKELTEVTVKDLSPDEYNTYIHTEEVSEFYKSNVDSLMQPGQVIVLPYRLSEESESGLTIVSKEGYVDSDTQKLKTKDLAFPFQRLGVVVYSENDNVPEKSVVYLSPLLQPQTCLFTVDRRFIGVKPNEPTALLIGTSAIQGFKKS